MLTRLYPMVQIEKDTWEIDEFDCASIFLLVGAEKALVIDTGFGIGDLRGAIEMITDKPLVCALTHGHIENTGNAQQFSEVWMHPTDQQTAFPLNIARRIYDAKCMAQRRKGAIGAPYNMFRLYAYDINTDIRECLPQEKPAMHDLVEGTVFDLGGRTVTVWECPGHTAGSVVLIDSRTRFCFAGKSLNYNLGISAVPVETSLRALKRLKSLGSLYDCIYNGSHDYRPLGMPLEDDCLENAIAICEDIVADHYSICEIPNYWHQIMPLSANPEPYNEPNMYVNKKNPPRRLYCRKGRNFLGFDPNLIYDPVG